MPETKPTGGDASNSSDGTLEHAVRVAGPSSLPQASQSEPDDAPGEFSEWFDAQPETVRTMVESHIHGLKSALERVKSERSSWREKFEKILKDRNLDAEEKLSELQSQLRQTERRARFLESAPPDLVDRSDAWTIAETLGLIGKSGEIDWDDLRSKKPHLFSTPGASGARALAGAGTDRPAKRPTNMNDWIRAQMK